MFESKSWMTWQPRRSYLNELFEQPRTNYPNLINLKFWSFEPPAEDVSTVTQVIS